MAGEDLRGRRLGGFDLIEPLGEGSFGTVWRARQVRLDRDVAVKVLDPVVARDPNAARRFEREGRAAASLDHPSIVPVYEAGDDGDLYYLVMRLVDGETLADVIDRQAPVSEAEAITLLGPIASALDAAHETGLVHRDVKPANILIENGTPYLSDFGIAASTREMGRYTTGSIGTAEYMAPEQARGEQVDSRSDLYALGCVLFHMVTGVSPFARDDIVATLLAHTVDEAPGTGDAGLDTFFDTALAKDPADRFQSGDEFMSAFAGSHSASSTPSSMSAGRRRRTFASAMAAVGALSFGVAALVVVGGGDDEPVDNVTPSTVVSDVIDVPTTVLDEPGTGDDGTGPAVTEPAESDDVVPSTASEVEGVVLQEGGTVRLGTTLDLDDPNPHSSLDTSKVLAEWVLPVMYRIDENLEGVPSLAVGPPVADPDDPLTLRWEIAADRVWDDGTQVTAADIAATYDYLASEGTSAQSLGLYTSVTSVTAESETELVITLTEPVGAAYLMFSTIHPIIKAAAWETHVAQGGSAADFLTGGVDFAAGPFRVATGRQNVGEIELIPNQGWNGDTRPALESVELASYPSSVSLVAAKARGEVDMIWVDDVTRDELRDAEAIAGTEVQVGTASVATQLTLNLKNTALQDPLVRQAIVHALDRDAIVDTAVGRKTNEVVDPWNSLVFAPGQRDDSMPFAASQFDPGLADDLLDQAGWTRPPGENVVRQNAAGELLELQGVLLADPDSTNAALEIADSLGAVGIQFRAATGDTGTTNERINTGAFDLLIQFRVFNSDPIATSFSFASDQCPATIQGCDGNGVNVGAFADPAVDAALDVAEVTADPSRRLDEYVEVDRLLHEAIPAIPLFVEPAFIAYDDDITGVVMAPNVGPLTSLADWALIQQ